MTMTTLAIPDAMAVAIQSAEKMLASLAERAAKIRVTSCEDVTMMKEADIIRKEGKALRCQVENCRVEYGEPAYAAYKRVNAFAKELTAKIEPIELAMKEAATFAIRAEQARKSLLAKERAEALMCFNYSPTDSLDLANMPDEQFVGLLEKAINDQQEREDAAVRAEEQRLRDEMKAKAEAAARAAEEQRIREENERLRNQEKIRRMKEETEARKRLELGKARVESLVKYGVLQDHYNAQMFGSMSTLDWEVSAGNYKRAHEEKMQSEAALDAERKAREAAELKAENEKQRAFMLQKQQEEKAAKAKAAEAKARKQAAAAPDKDKLLALAQALAEFPLPEMATDEGRDALRMIRDQLVKLAGVIVEKAGAL